MIILATIYLYRTNITETNDCQQKFNDFKQRFNKQYQSIVDENEAKNNLCQNYYNFIKLKSNQQCSRCRIHSNSDKPLPYTSYQLQNYDLNKLQSTTPNYELFVKDPLSKIADDQLPRSIDLRELGLITRPKVSTQCISQWSFSITSILENSILLDQKNYANNNLDFWGFNYQNLSLSEQFIISNDFNNQYCDDGNLSQSVNYIHQNLKTVEFSKNFAFSPSDTTNQINRQKNISLNPKIDSADFLLPFKLFKSTPNTTTPNVVLADGSSVFEKSTIQTIKSYLARGIAVAGAVDGSPLEFSYRGSNTTNYQACTNTGAYHLNTHVVFVGYGIKNSVEVWIVKNFWGNDWGDGGFFFVPIGKNAYCLEQYAVAIIPKFFEVTNTSIINDSADLSQRGLAAFLDKDIHFITKNCSQVYCYASYDNYMVYLPSLYESIDLREVNLTSTNSTKNYKVNAIGMEYCLNTYAFTMNRLMENAILRDQKLLKEREFKHNISNFDNTSSSKIMALELSELYLIRNSFNLSSASYCDKESDILMAFNNLYIYQKDIQTVEKLNNVNNDFSNTDESDAFANKQNMASKIAPDSFLLPFQELNDRQMNGDKTNVVLFNDDPDQYVFNPEVIQKIKNHLSKGLAVGVKLILTDDSFFWLSRSQIANNPCVFNKWTYQDYKQNPEKFNYTELYATIIGYGQKKNNKSQMINIWIVNPNRGQNFSKQGVAFIEIGSNSYCMEGHAFGIVPKYYNLQKQILADNSYQNRNNSNDYSINKDNLTIVCNANEGKIREFGEDICVVCHQIQMVKYGEKCYADCPTAANKSGVEFLTLYYDEGVCVAQCPNHSFLYPLNQSCEQSCSKYKLKIMKQASNSQYQCISSCRSQQFEDDTTQYTGEHVCTDKITCLDNQTWTLTNTTGKLQQHCMLKNNSNGTGDNNTTVEEEEMTEKEERKEEEERNEEEVEHNQPELTKNNNLMIYIAACSGGGGVLLVILIIVGVVICKKKKKQKQQKLIINSNEQQTPIEMQLPRIDTNIMSTTTQDNGSSQQSLDSLQTQTQPQLQFLLPPLMKQKVKTSVLQQLQDEINTEEISKKLKRREKQKKLKIKLPTLIQDDISKPQTLTSQKSKDISELINKYDQQFEQSVKIKNKKKIRRPLLPVAEARADENTDNTLFKAIQMEDQFRTGLDLENDVTEVQIKRKMLKSKPMVLKTKTEQVQVLKLPKNNDVQLNQKSKMQQEEDKYSLYFED